MRAPVYRNIEADSTFLGLSFPVELLFVLFAYWLFLTVLPVGPGLLCGVGTYVLVRAVGRRRGPKFLQHWLVFRTRQVWTGSWLSSAARAPAPRFPYARYEWREGPRLVLRSALTVGRREAVAGGREGDISDPRAEASPATAPNTQRPTPNGRSRP